MENLTPYLTTFNLLLLLPLLVRVPPPHIPSEHGLTSSPTFLSQGSLYLVTEAFYNLFLNLNKQYPGPLLAALTKVTAPPPSMSMPISLEPRLIPLALYRHPLAHRPLPQAHPRPTPTLRPRSPHRSQ